MENLTNIPTVAHVIQQALTPVFLLGGVAAILNVLTGRLARAVDRFRVLDDANIKDTDGYKMEMHLLPARVRLIQWSISLCTVCALLVCGSIVTLFLGAELGLNISRIISILFILAILALTMGLLCLLREITLATGNIIAN
ncbi:MAG: DUF2721 domain-containing protein [Methylomonas sp.]|jgi:hypothetical protein